MKKISLSVAILVEPNDTQEYFEFRGVPGATIEDDVYFTAIDGEDAGTNIGLVRDAVNLSGLTFGANGLLVVYF